MTYKVNAQVSGEDKSCRRENPLGKGGGAKCSDSLSRVEHRTLRPTSFDLNQTPFQQDVHGLFRQRWLRSDKPAGDRRRVAGGLYRDAQKR